MSTFGIAFFVTVGVLVLALWAAIYADTVGPGITRVAHTAGRALVRLFTRNPIKHASGGEIRQWDHGDSIPAVLHPGYHVDNPRDPSRMSTSHERECDCFACMEATRAALAADRLNDPQPQKD